MPSAPHPTSDDLLGLLRGVVDPELGSDVVDLGMIRSAVIDADGAVDITVALTTLGCPLQAQLRKDIRARVGGAPGVTHLDIDWVEMTDEERSATMAKARWNAAQRAGDTAVPTTTRVLAVASGKGGVGKSSITVNLAAGLAARGYAVGVLDADIGGFSVPRMLGVDGRLAGREATADETAEGASPKIAPQVKTIGAGYVEVVSMGLLVDDESEALLWRGQLLNRALQHFLEDVAWGQLDYLLIDMPPGTADVQMGLARMLPRTEMVLVTTPAQAAQRVAARAADLARKTYLRIAGVVENMSAFTCDHGETYELFGAGGGQALADEIGVPLLASIPIESSVVTGGDLGQPAVLGTGPAADALRELARVIAEEAAPPLDLASCSARLLAHVEEALAAHD
ncbi:MAG TPA: Mrp/NBP35 family ATP-binding protein [Acidimicrobiales bacterium]